MKPITRKDIAKEYLRMLGFGILFVILMQLSIILVVAYLSLKNGKSIDFVKIMQISLDTTITPYPILYPIVWLIFFLWRIIFFPTGDDKVFNRIANSNWVKELSLLGFINVQKQFFGVSHIFEFRGIYENIIFTFYNLRMGDHITNIEIYIVLNVDEKITNETHEWSYMRRDFRLEYEHQNISLSETRLSRTLDIKDAFDDKKMWETMQLFVKIMNETVYNDKKLLDYMAVIPLKKSK